MSSEFFFNLSFLLLLILLLRVRVLVSPPPFLHCICPQVFHSCPLSPSSSLRLSRALLHLLSEHKHRLLRKFLLVQIWAVNRLLLISLLLLLRLLSLLGAPSFLPTSTRYFQVFKHRTNLDLPEKAEYLLSVCFLVDILHFLRACSFGGPRRLFLSLLFLRHEKFSTRVTCCLSSITRVLWNNFLTIKGVRRQQDLFFLVLFTIFPHPKSLLLN